MGNLNSYGCTYVIELDEYVPTTNVWVVCQKTFGSNQIPNCRLLYKAENLFLWGGLFK